MNDHNGWIGTRSQVLYALSVVNADRDATGAYLLYGAPGQAPVAFMGDASENAEVVIPSGCDYSVGGQKRSLAGLLASTSYGMSVKVY